ncbi:hypothetical protein [Sphingomonas ginsenosidimutans]|jgi:hypothetical protein|uniref:hypothetical protein n=1 Tax=Sphingomonas ginsenosidimutans TaxID=862134 RepID=UPI001144BC9A|nr:hypothetical protein [Sphingomonas ginsenosidimutans]
MKTMLLWDPICPGCDPVRTTLPDPIASLIVRSGIGTPADPSEFASLSNGAAVSGAYPVPVTLPIAGRSAMTINLPLAIARAVVANGIGAILPEEFQDGRSALLTADGSDFLVSPIDGRQLFGAM